MAPLVASQELKRPTNQTNTACETREEKISSVIIM